MSVLRFLKLHRKMIIILVGCVFIVGSAFSLWMFFYISGENLNCWQADNLPSLFLESEGRFKLPSSAHLVEHATQAGWSWCDIAVKFEMQPNDLNSFWASTHVGHLSSELQPNCIKAILYKNMPSFGIDFQKAGSMLCQSDTTDYFNQQYVFVDKSNPHAYRVYLVTEFGFLD